MPSYFKKCISAPTYEKACYVTCANLRRKTCHVRHFTKNNLEFYVRQLTKNMLLCVPNSINFFFLSPSTIKRRIRFFDHFIRLPPSLHILSSLCFPLCWSILFIVNSHLILGLPLIILLFHSHLHCLFKLLCSANYKKTCFLCLPT